MHHDDTLRWMIFCSQDLDEFDSNDKDDVDAEESVVNDDAVKEVTNDIKESEDDAEDEDDDSPAAFTRDAIGAGHGKLWQVLLALRLVHLLLAQSNILLFCLQIFVTFVSIPRRRHGS
jgi:hypothetical protein